MTQQELQAQANEDFKARATDFDKGLEALKKLKEVNLGVNLVPANRFTKLLGYLHLVKIQYSIIILDNKVLTQPDGVQGENSGGNVSNS